MGLTQVNKTWIHHGESDLPPPFLVIDNTRQPQMSDMTACFNDLSYIPLNNKQNEPTQGDISETSNDLTQAKHNKFEELYASANKELWKDSNTPWKKVPKKVLCYFSIIPRLQRFYKSSHTAKEMTWHATGKYTKPDNMQHPVDGRAWKDFNTKYSDFSAEPRNVRLGLVLMVSICLETLVSLTACKDIDVYFRLLIDDLKDLWAKTCVETINVATSQKFNMRAMIHQRQVDNDPGVNESNELFALACGPSQTPISVNSCVVNDVSLNDLEITALHIDGQSIDVDALPDIIDVINKDDDIIDAKVPIPYDLADSDDEDLINLDIDDGVNMSADVARGHGGNGAGVDHPPPYHVPTGCGGCLGNREGEGRGKD
nr:hypothetical protein [Tanacetum cinerariifolium]